MKVDVLIAGAGPAGLAAAVELRRAGVSRAGLQLTLFSDLAGG